MLTLGLGKLRRVATHETINGGLRSYINSFASRGKAGHSIASINKGSALAKNWNSIRPCEELELNTPFLVAFLSGVEDNVVNILPSKLISGYLEKAPVRFFIHYYDWVGSRDGYLSGLSAFIIVAPSDEALFSFVARHAFGNLTPKPKVAVAK